MQHGIDTEDEARLAYELKAWQHVEEIGFVSKGDYMGCSPDGLIGDNGGVEIKCPQPQTHLSYLLDISKLVKAYHWQTQGFLWVTGREWIDLVSYCPSYEDPGNGDMELIVARLEPDKIAV